jgi:tetratricopeptide (TPR) repeat protein
MDYVLKRILPSGVDAALQKADKYRELNQPAEAESICRDVLAVDPDNQLALRVLGLAVTDQFDVSGARVLEAQEIFGRLRDPYERAFYTGLTWERRAKAQLSTELPSYALRPLFDAALARYAEAETLRPPGNDDAILRWNSCVRALQAVSGSMTTEGQPPTEWEGDFVPGRR